MGQDYSIKLFLRFQLFKYETKGFPALVLQAVNYLRLKDCESPEFSRSISTATWIHDNVIDTEDTANRIEAEYFISNHTYNPMISTN